MPPRIATRTVRLRHPPLPAHVERMQLLTYPMALAQAGASVPLVQGNSTSSSSSSGGMSAVPPSSLSHFEGGALHNASAPHDASQHDGHAEAQRESTLPVPRRWVRDADELCIASIHRSNNINRINSYVATYKFDDPQWRSLLLPEVHVLPKPPQPSTLSSSGGGGDGNGAAPPTDSSRSTPEYDVFIDYNKLTTLELISRHANYALRHLVQKGHAMYLVNFAQHSLVQMRGLVEASYVSCAYGIKGERLRTHITHTGPIDVRDIIEVDPRTQRVSFNFKKPNIRRGVVAVSMVEGYGTWFQRKPMLWQRTRRIGALQSQMGSYDYQLCDPAEVGRVRSCEVSLLAPHVRLIGARGGAEAVALVASSQVAQNEKLYMGQFEAPVLTAIDAVQQLAHRTALHHKLLRPAVQESVEDEEKEASAGQTFEDPILQERRRLASMERFLPVSWVTRTPPPYVPLEADLPFRIQLARPAVIRTDQQAQKGTGAAAFAFPTGGAVGSPFVKGVPLTLMEYNIHQGVDHYIFDDAPSARPMKWWNQKSNMPYNGYLYGMRSGLLDFVEPAETLANPLAPPGSGKTTGKARVVKSARHRRSRRLRRQQTRTQPSEAEGAAGAPVNPSAQEGEEQESELIRKRAASVDNMGDEGRYEGDVDGVSSMEINLAGEELLAGAEDLAGHDDDARQAAALKWVEEGSDAALSDRPALHTLVAPNTAAQRRLRRYAKKSSDKATAESGTARQQTASAMSSAGAKRESGAAPPSAGLEGRADALLQRQLRLRKLRRRQERKKSAAQHAGAAEESSDTSEK